MRVTYILLSEGQYIIFHRKSSIIFFLGVFRQKSYILIHLTLLLIMEIGWHITVALVDSFVYIKA